MTCGKTALLTASTALLALGFSGVTAFATPRPPVDTAGNYTGGLWSTTPPNNGTGFGAWSVNVQNNDGPPYAGTFLAGAGDTPIVDGSGNAWGVYANSAQGNTLPAVTFTRPFTAGVSGSSSLFDQTFSFRLGTAGVGPGQGLLSAGVGSAFLLQYNGAGADNLLLSIDGGTANGTGVGFTAINAGLNISLAVSGALNSPTENYALTIASLSNTLCSLQSGTFDSSAFNTSQFQFGDANTTGNGYFNSLNMTVESVPEPSSVAIFAMSGFGMLMAFRRRK